MTTLMPTAACMAATIMIVALVFIIAMQSNSQISNKRKTRAIVDDAHEGWLVKLLKILYYAHFAVLIIAGAVSKINI